MKVPAISVPEVDTFGSHKHRKIRVWKDPKFSACCDMMAKLDLPTDAAWKLLTHVDNYKILSALKVSSGVSIQQCTIVVHQVGTSAADSRLRNDVAASHAFHCVR